MFQEGNKKIIFLAVVSVVIVAAGLLAYFFLWKSRPAEPGSSAGKSLEKILEDDLTAPVAATPAVAPEIINSLSAPAPTKPAKGATAPAQTAVPQNILNSLSAPGSK